MHWLMWRLHIGRITAIGAWLAWLASDHPWALAGIAATYVALIRVFLVSGAGILITSTVDVELALDDSVLEVRFGRETRRYAWGDVAALVPFQDFEVLWFNDGGVLPVPVDSLSPGTLAGHVPDEARRGKAKL